MKTNLSIQLRTAEREAVQSIMQDQYNTAQNQLDTCKKIQIQIATTTEDYIDSNGEIYTYMVDGIEKNTAMIIARSIRKQSTDKVRNRAVVTVKNGKYAVYMNRGGN